ncbi:MAG: GumC family protein [Deltaproteobacteria bacterium]|nr:GumC family protein [Deltaproteobacteria bacterium]
MEDTNFSLIRESKGGSLRDFLAILFKRKAAILTIFLATVVTVTVGSFLMAPTYESHSSLLVKFGREFIYRAEVGDKAPIIAFNQEEAINSEINILTSRDLVERVIKTIGLKNIYPDLVEKPPARMTAMEAAVIAFQKKLTAEGIKKSSVIEVSFQHQDPKVAARAVNLLVDFFKEKHLEVHSGTQSTFLESQTNRYDQELKNSENRLEAFKQKNRVFSLEEQRTLLLRQRTELDTTLKGTKNRIDEVDKKLASLRGQMKTLLADKDRFTQTERDKIIVEARAKLLTLQLSEQDLSSKYTDHNRLLVNVRKEIQIIRDFLKEQEEAIGGKVRTGNPVYQEAEKVAIMAEAEEVSLRTKAATLQMQIAQLDQDIRTLDLQEKDLKELKREVTTNDKNFQTYLDKKEEARISDEMNRQKLANINVIQAAVAPSKPIKPKKALNILLSIILGAVSGLGFAFLSEYTSQRFSSPESVEQRLGLPVLVAIPMKD